MRQNNAASLAGGDCPSLNMNPATSEHEGRFLNSGLPGAVIAESGKQMLKTKARGSKAVKEREIGTQVGETNELS
jgi:hypothetical protein